MALAYSDSDIYEVNWSAIEAKIGRERMLAVFIPIVRQEMDVIRGKIALLLPDGATGNLGRSVQTHVFETETNIEGHVGTNSPYAYYVEEGRGPGKMPPWSQPTDPLYMWAQRKLTSAAYKETGKVKKLAKHKFIDARTNTEYTGNREVRSLAYLVARKIEKVGTPAQHPFQKGFQQGLPHAKQVIQYGLSAIGGSV